MTTHRLPLHPGHGVQDPARTLQHRRPGSVRRTTTLDVLRGRDGVVLRGRGRDLYTPATGGTPVVLASTDLLLQTHGTDGVPVLAAATAAPRVQGLESLVGLEIGRGFRRAVAERTAASPGTLPHLVLDDAPMGVLVGGYASMHEVALRDPTAGSIPLGAAGLDVFGRDGCAGYASGGTIMTAIESGRRAVASGPVAPSLSADDDHWAWHEEPTDSLAHAVRRRRCVDVSGADGGPWQVDSFYRDTHVAAVGLETVIHEYTVRALVDPALTVVQCTADQRVLPFRECLPAANSATRLEGLPIADLRRGVQRTLTGPSTCTHLNDQLRGLADTEALIALLRSQSGPTGP